MSRLAIFVLTVSILVAGCSSGRSLDGKWNVSSDSMPKGSTMVATFSKPSNVEMDIDIPEPLPDGSKIQLHGVVKGTYELKGELMTLHADDVKFTGTGFPPALKSQLEGNLGVVGEQTKKKLNEEGATKFAWVNDDTVTMTGKDGKPETFTRIK